MTIDKRDLGVDPLTGVHTYEVVDTETGKVIGYDYVAPDTEE